MTDAYHTILSYSGTDWPGLFEQMGLSDGFDPLLQEFSAPESMRKILKYILWTYSMNSDKLIQGMDWEENKRKNFNLAGLPASLYEPIAMLTDPIILGAVHGWLDYQGSRIFKELQILRDLKAEMLLSCVTPIRKASNEIDYDQKFKNAQYAIDLDKMIQQLETQSVEQHPHLKLALQQSGFKPRRLTVGVETFSTGGT